MTIQLPEEYRQPEIEALQKAIASIEQSALELRDINLSEYWYGLLLKIYELPRTKPINRLGFLAEADVDPGSTYTYTCDLTGTSKACICPKFVASCDLGVFGKLTNLINESPMNTKLTKGHPEWMDKYVARDAPLPSDIPHSLHNGWDYVVFPKQKIKVTFSNEHPSETGHFVFFADYFETNLDYAVWVTENIYLPFVARLENLILPPRG